MTAYGSPLVGVYDYRLVVLSVVIAIFAAYAALDLAGRVTASRGFARMAWLSGGAFAMGIGIWSMHYIGMEALQLPVSVMYDWPTVVLSMIAAIAASAVALYVVSRKTMSLTAAIAGSIVMGSGIAAMHYMGGCQAEALKDRAEQMRKAISDVPFMTQQGPLSVSMSIGAITIEEWDKSLTIELLLKQVDGALYRAKTLGRDRVVYAESMVGVASSVSA